MSNRKSNHARSNHKHWLIRRSLSFDDCTNRTTTLARCWYRHLNLLGRRQRDPRRRDSKCAGQRTGNRRTARARNNRRRPPKRSRGIGFLFRSLYAFRELFLCEITQVTFGECKREQHPVILVQSWGHISGSRDSSSSQIL